MGVCQSWWCWCVPRLPVYCCQVRIGFGHAYENVLSLRIGFGHAYENVLSSSRRRPRPRNNPVPAETAAVVVCLVRMCTAQRPFAVTAATLDQSGQRIILAIYGNLWHYRCEGIASIHRRRIVPLWLVCSEAHASFVESWLLAFHLLERQARRARILWKLQILNVPFGSPTWARADRARMSSMGHGGRG
jgi:hypothetical protein